MSFRIASGRPDVGCQKAAWSTRAPAAGAAELSRTQLVPVGTVRAVSADILQADIALLRVMVLQEIADAEYALGERYGKGKGVPQDDKAAAKWFLKAAQQGHADAQYKIGCCDADGLGVAQDYKAALDLHLKPTQHGHVQAQTNTGVCFS